jgi:hypothetical protein
VCFAASRAAAVFVGRVTALPSGVEFEVERAFAGVKPGRITLANGPGTCAFRFTPGERYIVYAYQDSSTGILSTSICTRTRPLSDPRTRSDLAYWTRRQRGATGSLLTGVVQDVTLDLATPLAQPRPLADIRITATPLDEDSHATTATTRTTATTKTRADGSYEVTGLQAGRWSIAASLPAQFESRPPVMLMIADSDGCAEANIGTRLDGRISGRLLDERSQPLRGVAVQLADVAAARAVKWPLRTIDAATDDEGTFEFRYVGPGRYVVGVDIQTPVRPGTLNRRRFFTDTLDPAAATVVTLAAAEHRQLPPFRLPPLPADRIITVVIEAPTPEMARVVTLFLTGATRERLEYTGQPLMLHLPLGASYLLDATTSPGYSLAQPRTVQISRDETDRTIVFRLEKP